MMSEVSTSCISSCSSHECAHDHPCINSKRTIRIIDGNQRYGAHMSLRKTLHESLSPVPGLRTAQIYLGSQLQYRVRTLTESDRDKTLVHCNRHDKTFYVHAPLVAYSNYSRPDVVMNSTLTMEAILKNLRDLPGATVMHIGKVGTIEQAATTLNDLIIERGNHYRMPRQLLLESAAGQGTELGRSWDQLRHLFEALDFNKIGLCLDTQHVFAAGMSSLDSHEAIIKLFDIADSITPGGVRMIHLNDSKTPYGSHVDRHQSLTEGHIWSRNDDGLHALFSQCLDRHLDMILETPNCHLDLDRIGYVYAREAREPTV